MDAEILVCATFGLLNQIPKIRASKVGKVFSQIYRIVFLVVFVNTLADYLKNFDYVLANMTDEVDEKNLWTHIL